MAAGQRQVVLAQGNFAQDPMRLKAIRATGQQPPAFVHGDVDLAGIDHLADFFEIFLAIASAARMHKFPSIFIGALARADRRSAAGWRA